MFACFFLDHQIYFKLILGPPGLVKPKIWTTCSKGWSRREGMGYGKYLVEEKNSLKICEIPERSYRKILFFIFKALISKMNFR
jgi:hypothetical protein